MIYWGMTDLYAGFVAWFVCTTVLIGAIWFPKSTKSDQRYQCFLVIGGRSIVFSAFAYYSIMFLDTVIKESTGLITTNNLNYHLGPMLLLTIIAILILFGSVFNAPTIRTLISFGIALGVYIYFFWFTDSLLDNVMKPIYIPPLYIFGAVFILESAMLIVRLIFKPWISKKPGRESWKQVLFGEKPLWDISSQFKQLTSLKVWIPLWILYSIEFVLDFNGYSLFSWVPESDIYWVLLIILVLIGLFIIIQIKKMKTHKNEMSLSIRKNVESNIKENDIKNSAEPDLENSDEQ